MMWGAGASSPLVLSLGHTHRQATPASPLMHPSSSSSLTGQAGSRCSLPRRLGRSQGRAPQLLQQCCCRPCAPGPGPPAPQVMPVRAPAAAHGAACNKRMPDERQGFTHTCTACTAQQGEHVITSGAGALRPPPAPAALAGPWRAPGGAWRGFAVASCFCPCCAGRPPADRGARGRAGPCRERPHRSGSPGLARGCRDAARSGVYSAIGLRLSAAIGLRSLLRCSCGAHRSSCAPDRRSRTPSTVRRANRQRARALPRPPSVGQHWSGKHGDVAWPRSFSEQINFLAARLQQTMQAQAVAHSAFSATSHPQAAAAPSRAWSTAHRLAPAPRQQQAPARRTAAAAAAGGDVAASPTPGIKPDATSIIGNTPMVRGRLAGQLDQGAGHPSRREGVLLTLPARVVGHAYPASDLCSLCWLMVSVCSAAQPLHATRLPDLCYWPAPWLLLRRCCPPACTCVLHPFPAPCACTSTPSLAPLACLSCRCG